MKDPKLIGFLVVFTGLSLGSAFYLCSRLTGPFAGEADLGPWVLGTTLGLGLGLPSTFALLPWSGRRSVDRLQTLGYALMGYLSILLVGLVTVDLLRLGSAGLRGLGVSGAWTLPWELTTSPVHQGLVLGLLGATLVLGTLALLSARRPARIVQLEVPIPDLPEALRGLRIVQLSDIHIGPGIGRRRVQAIVDACNALQPELVALTGDLADRAAALLEPHARPLAELKAAHGVWFITGNHDYYSGVDPWCDLAHRLGMQVLINESRSVAIRGEQVQVAGVTDPAGSMFAPDHRPQLSAARGEGRGDVALRVLLAHQPSCAPAAADLGFDLQLSGHTHGGQFFPHTLLVHLAQRYVAGLYSVQAMKLFVHRGTTWWGPPMRLGSRHEIVQLELVPG